MSLAQYLNAQLEKFLAAEEEHLHAKAFLRRMTREVLERRLTEYDWLITNKPHDRAAWTLGKRLTNEVLTEINR